MSAGRRCEKKGASASAHTLLSPVGKMVRRFSRSSFILSNSRSSVPCTWALVITSLTTSSCNVRLSARSLLQSNLNLDRRDHVGLARAVAEPNVGADAGRTSFQRLCLTA